MNTDQINKFLNGQLNQKEKAAFLEWAGAEAALPLLKKHLQDLWNKDDLFIDPAYNEREILQRIHLEINKHLHKQQKKTANRIWKYAAVLFIFASLSYIIYYFASFPDKNIPSVISLTRSTPIGQKLNFSLPDGSHVILNSSSFIHYTESDSIRLVNMEGEAFFRIMKNEIKPLIVNAGDLSALAVGTEFNVLCRLELPYTFVSLIEGRVEISNENYIDPVMLVPGEQVIYKKKTSEIKKDNWDYFKVFGWKDGILYLHDMKFLEILNKLQLWYGVSFNINKEIDIPKHYTGKFQNEPLENVLESLSFIYGFTYDINNKEININFL